MSVEARSSDSDLVRRARAAEDTFIATARAAMDSLPADAAPGRWFETQERDAAEDVHKAMVERRLFGADRRKSMPQGRVLVRRGFRRRWLLGRRLSSVTAAGVLSSPGSLLDDRPQPVGLAEVSRFVREVTGLTPPRVRRLVVVCSPTGFAPEVWSAGADLTSAGVILVEPLADGGWKTAAIGDGVDPKLVSLFDPEGDSDKRDRVRREIEERRADLLLGGVSAERIAERLRVPVGVVERVMESVCASDPELRVSRVDGRAVLYRGMAGDAQEDRSMGVTHWLRSLFSGRQDDHRQINHLIERRNALASRRDRIYEDVARLEKREQALFEEGRQATAAVVKRRVASQVAQLRKEIARWNTSASLLNQQINVLSTDIHNLTLLQQGQLAKLPSAEELTEHAVAAEEMLETLAADARLVDGLEAGIAQTAMSDDEAAILKELEQPEYKEAKVELAAEPPVREPTAGEAGAAQRRRPQAE